MIKELFKNKKISDKKMVCKVCGKDVKYPRSKSHINSRYHQAALVKRDKPAKQVEVSPEVPKPYQIPLKNLKHIDYTSFLKNEKKR